MDKKLKNLMDRMPPERRERIEEEAEAILLEMALQEWRQTRDLTPAQSADVLNVHQAAFSKPKEGTQKQADMHVSTLLERKLNNLPFCVGQTSKVSETFEVFSG